MYIKGRERGVYLVLVDKIDLFQPSGGELLVAFDH